MIYDKLEIGSKVWSLQWGWGVVTDLYPLDQECPIVCIFKGARETYTKKGKFRSIDNTPSLFLEEQKIVPAEKVLEVGTQVFCIANGWGIVSRIDLELNRPIVVEFDEVDTMAEYTLEGKKQSIDQYNSLFFEKPAVFKYTLKE